MADENVVAVGSIVSEEQGASADKDETGLRLTYIKRIIVNMGDNLAKK